MAIPQEVKKIFDDMFTYAHSNYIADASLEKTCSIGARKLAAMPLKEASRLLEDSDPIDTKLKAFFAIRHAWKQDWMETGNTRVHIQPFKEQGMAKMREVIDMVAGSSLTVQEKAQEAVRKYSESFAEWDLAKEKGLAKERFVTPIVALTR